MRPRPILASTALLTAWLGLANRAAADSLTAEALFREGRRLLDEGRIAEACTKLGESQAQDPASGTLINLALCYEKGGKLATAWATYLAAAALARKDGRADRVLSAEQKAREIEPRVPRLSFRAAEPPPGLIIAWGTSRVGSGALGSAIPVDPGSYGIEVSADGFEAWAQTVEVAEGESRVIEIPPLHAARPRAISRPPSAAIQRRLPTPAPGSRPPSARPAERGAQGSWLLPVSVAAAGAVALGVGTYFGFRSLSEYADAERACPNHRDCGAAAVNSWHRARTSAWVANIGIPLGAAGLALSGWLFWTNAAHRSPVAVAITPSARGASMALRLEL